MSGAQVLHVQVGIRFLVAGPGDLTTAGAPGRRQVDAAISTDVGHALTVESEQVDLFVAALAADRCEGDAIEAGLASDGFQDGICDAVGQVSSGAGVAAESGAQQLLAIDHVVHKDVCAELLAGGIAGGVSGRQQAGFYADMLVLLGKNGFRRPSWQSPLVFAQEIAVDRERVGGLMKVLTLRYYGIRFGNMQLSLEEQKDSKAKVEELRSVLERAK